MGSRRCGPSVCGLAGESGTPHPPSRPNGTPALRSPTALVHVPVRSLCEDGCHDHGRGEVVALAVVEGGRGAAWAALCAAGPSDDVLCGAGGGGDACRAFSVVGAVCVWGDARRHVFDAGGGVAAGGGEAGWAAGFAGAGAVGAAAAAVASSGVVMPTGMAQLTIYGAHVPVGLPALQLYTDAEREVWRIARAAGAIRSTEAGRVVHAHRRNGCSGANPSARACCEYAAEDGRALCMRLVKRGLMRRAAPGDFRPVVR